MVFLTTLRVTRTGKPTQEHGELVCTDIVSVVEHTSRINVTLMRLHPQSCKLDRQQRQVCEAGEANRDPAELPANDFGKDRSAV
jgi:hypothetical protein